MKEQLDDETRTAMVDYRLERARQTLGEETILTQRSIGCIMLVIMPRLLCC